jgi:hypothetical protein
MKPPHDLAAERDAEPISANAHPAFSPRLRVVRP